MGIQGIVSKYRRALRNGTGATFSLEQLREMAECGVLETLAVMEANELCPAKIANMSSEITGSISGATASRRVSTRSPDMKPRAALDRSSIKALVSGF